MQPLELLYIWAGKYFLYKFIHIRPFFNEFVAMKKEEDVLFEIEPGSLTNIRLLRRGRCSYTKMASLFSN